MRHCGINLLGEAVMRISFYVQLVAFTLALLTPLAVLAGGEQEIVIVCTGYAWVVGIAAALWNRLTVVE